jgi:hypothetical protein
MQQMLVIVAIVEPDRGLLHMCIVAYRSVVKQWLCKQRPLLGKAHNTHVTI